VAKDTLLQLCMREGENAFVCVGPTHTEREKEREREREKI